MKKKILFVYPSMMIGGSTTALLSLLNCLDTNKYEIDLQLFRNEGPLINAIPEHVNLLPEAELYKGVRARIVKLCRFLLGGYAFRLLVKGKKWRSGILFEFQARQLSRKNENTYDYAIGFLEGWSDWYLAFVAKAGKKYGWIHSTFEKITTEPKADVSWLKLLDKIVFVTDACRLDFNKTLPQMAEKTVTIKNITDSEIIRKRSLQTDENDAEYRTFATSQRFKIITVCRLTISVKGLDRIVNAAKELKSKGYQFSWYIIGDGEDKLALQQLIQRAGVEDRVVLIGKRMNPYPFIAAADLMCMPSRYEGKPITVTESMILGVPPVVTEYLSAHEQIEDRKDGIVLENRDDGLAECLENCLQNAQILERLKEHLHAKEYGNKDYLPEIEKTLFS